MNQGISNAIERRPTRSSVGASRDKAHVVCVTLPWSGKREPGREPNMALISDCCQDYLHYRCQSSAAEALRQAERYREV